jgi:hypothetical protein
MLSDSPAQEPEPAQAPTSAIDYVWKSRSLTDHGQNESERSSMNGTK